MVIARIRDKGALPSPPNQNLQIMRSKLYEEDLKVNIVLQSGLTTGVDKGKQPEDIIWVHKALVKEVEFDLERAKETFMEAKKSFIDTSSSGEKDKSKPEMDPSMLMTFLETCMKILCDSKAIKGLQELINRCIGIVPRELHVVWKIGNNKTRTQSEMRLTMQIREFEMDQLILD